MNDQQPQPEKSTWQPNLIGPGARSIARQEELFPEAVGRKPTRKPIDPDQQGLFAAEDERI